MRQSSKSSIGILKFFFSVDVSRVGFIAHIKSQLGNMERSRRAPQPKNRFSPKNLAFYFGSVQLVAVRHVFIVLQWAFLPDATS